MVRRDGRRWRLEWVLSPDGKEAIEELHQKIRSKMDTAKILGAFFVALLTFAAGELRGLRSPPAWYPWIAGAGVTLLAGAASAYFLTMFWYDRLLMPVRFWASPRPRSTRKSEIVRRPPSSASWVLYQNMMMVWRRVFIPATLFGGAGTALVAVALAKPSGVWWPVMALASGVVALWVLLILIWGQPRLGVSD
jgi:hypothetical protein